MTKFKVEYRNDSTLVIVRGHSGYADYGHDIVCASISTACITSANLIERLNLADNIIEVISEDAYFKLETKNADSTVNIIIENLVATLKELQEQYPKYIKFEN